MKRARHQSKNGFSLIEMVLVIGIIGILAGLLLGAVFKAQARAKDKIWRIEAYSCCDYIRDHLSRYYQAQKNYPVLTAAELHEKGVFDNRIMDFLECPHVQFIPFSMSDRDDKIILRIDNYWVFNQKPVAGHLDDLVLMKKHVTKPQ